MDKLLRELAEYYGLELRDEPGCVIVEKDGTERPARKEDAITLLGLSHPFLDFDENKDLNFTWENNKDTVRIRAARFTFNLKQDEYEILSFFEVA